MKRNENPSNVVGINVIRGRVYQAYGNTLSEFELLNFYKKLVQGVEERGWDWVLFSNGMAADQKFGTMLLRALGCSDRTKILPTANNSVDFSRTNHVHVKIRNFYSRLIRQRVHPMHRM